MSEEDEPLTLAKATLDQYQRMGARYFSGYQDLTGESPFDDLDAFFAFLEEEINYRYRRSTIIAIRVAVRRILKLNGVQDDLPDFIPVEGRGSLRGKRRKMVPDKVANAMRREVFHNTAYGDKARLAVMMMYSSIYFGLRPSEWFCASFTHDDPEVLVIRNAKFDLLRGKSFGVSRRVVVKEDMPDHILDGARWVIDEVQRQSLSADHPSEVSRKVMESMAKSVGRVYDAVIEKGVTIRSRNGYRCTLYSGRHQFAANAKKSGLTKIEVAALMGHASVDTAGENYGKSNHGSKDVMHVSPHEDDVMAVEMRQFKKKKYVIPSFVS